MNEINQKVKRRFKRKFTNKDLTKNVGGKGDCWKKLFVMQGGEPDEPKTLAELIIILINSMIFKLGPDCHKLPYMDPKMCYLCMQEGHNCAPPITTSPLEDALLQFMMKFTIVEGGLHLERYRWSSRFKCDESYISLDALFAGVIDNYYNKKTAMFRTHENALDLAVGLTSFLVLGTNRDVQPAVEATSSMYCAAEIERAKESNLDIINKILGNEITLLSKESGPPIEALVGRDPIVAASLQQSTDSITH